MRKSVFAAVIALLFLVAPAAAAAAELKVDTGEYPLLRLTWISEQPTSAEPQLSENGRAVPDVVATNLGDAKSVVVVVDRSHSMEGKPLGDATAGAAAFVKAKKEGDRVAVVGFGATAVMLTGFSSSTAGADGAFRTMAVDSTIGTALYDAVALAAHSLGNESLAGRVIVVLTDGADSGSEASLEEAVAAARNAGASVYTIGIQSSPIASTALEQLARETGGSYSAAASSGAVSKIYTSISEELNRTWRLEYVTGALPSEHVSLAAKVPGGEAASARLRAPGAAIATRKPEAPGRLPEQFFGSVWGEAAFALVVGLCVLLAFAFLFAAPKGAWLRGRLAPHVVEKRRDPKRASRERLALAAGLFKATENTLGNMKPWKRVGRVLEQADLPLRTVEFVYVMLGGALLGVLITASLSSSLFASMGGLVVGGFLPYSWVSMKARRRRRAFENQLPDLLITMAAGLKAGHSFRQALQSVVDEEQPPASKELKRVLTETRLGRPMDEALEDMAHRIGSKNFEFVITAVTIQRQVGGSLAGLFDMVADTVRNRQQFAKKIKGLTAMGRASAYVLIALPFFVGAMLTMLNSEYMRPLWHSSTGHKLIIVTFVMMGVGSLILRKIVNFRY
jgi:tight adherence protein B